MSAATPYRGARGALRRAQLVEETREIRRARVGELVEAAAHGHRRTESLPLRTWQRQVRTGQYGPGVAKFAMAGSRFAGARGRRPLPIHRPWRDEFHASLLPVAHAVARRALLDKV